jgi:hypothetical protein
MFDFLQGHYLPVQDKDTYKVKGLYWRNGKPLKESYAGLIPIRNAERTNNERKTQSGELFFWYFSVQNESLKSTAPLIIWLQGGRMFCINCLGVCVFLILARILINDWSIL